MVPVKIQSEVVSVPLMVWPTEIVVDGQPPPPAVCETVKFWPLTVIIPVRAGPVLAATAKFTEPLPEPLLVVVIQFALLAAAQAQPADVAMPKDPLPPADAKLWLLGLRVYVQPPPQLAGVSVAAMWVVPSLPTADTPMP